MVAPALAVAPLPLPLTPPLLPLRTPLGRASLVTVHPTARLQELAARLEQGEGLARATATTDADTVRNFRDAVQVLGLSGEEECEDAETQGLNAALTNVLDQDLEQFLGRPDLAPLSNLALRTTLFVHLQRLIYKEPNLKEQVVKEVGAEDLQEFDQVTAFYSARGDAFVPENTCRCVWLYHRLRNLGLRYVLRKLGGVYTKMRGVLARPSQDPAYSASVSLLSRLMGGAWREQVLLSEDRNYDFDFLITILMYWKREKSQPPGAGSGEERVPPPPRVMEAPQPPTAAQPSLRPAKQELRPIMPSPAPQKPPPSSAPVKQESAAAPAPVGGAALSVAALHELRERLEGDAAARARVLGGVGQQAYTEFRNLVSSASSTLAITATFPVQVGNLTDRQVRIQDANVKTLYYTILNFAKFPVTAAMRKFEPLSNFSLR